ncbi:hypothetical protein CRP01_06815 [Flavilitoribacter nigricans DSM 23189 = NBRC 102662]|uniref:Secretion system C-terminal sorting domain-containing protein n=2 Tax=Flavilitoribacter TaxID=2762562 RepID=A0A2D0NG28_FLAN2|nr:hypothetical protein CRP01_06815 [Flavilitoribacter nigricans DSM 23189 = NBRC 102662]
MGILALAFGITLSAQPDVIIDSIFIGQDTLVPDSSGSVVMLEDTIPVFTDSFLLQVKTTTESELVYWRFSGDFDGDGSITAGEIFTYGGFPPEGEPNGGVILQISQLNDRDFSDLVEVSLEVVTDPGDFGMGTGQEIIFDIIVLGGGRLAVGNSTSGGTNSDDCPYKTGTCRLGKVKNGILEFYVYNFDASYLPLCDAEFSNPNINISIFSDPITKIEDCTPIPLSTAGINIEVYGPTGTLTSMPTGGIFDIVPGGSAKFEIPLSSTCVTDVGSLIDYSIYVEIPYLLNCVDTTIAPSMEFAGGSMCFGCEQQIEYSYHTTEPTLWYGPNHLPRYSRATESITLYSDVTVESGDMVEMEVDPDGFIHVKKFVCDPGTLGTIAKSGSFFYAHRSEENCILLAANEAPEIPPDAASPIREPIEVAAVKVYPNPVRDHFTVDLFLPGESRVSLVLFDIFGRAVKQAIPEQVFSPGEHNLRISAHDLADGMYYGQVRIGNRLETIPLVKSQ